MKHIDITKKRPTRWPWIIGFLLVLLVAWGVNTLLTSGSEAEPEISVPTVEDTQPPSAMPRSPGATGTSPADTTAPADEPAPLDDATPPRRD